MPIRGLFNLTDRLLERALDGISLRQRVSAHNIANVDTPGYKKQRLNFEEILRRTMEEEPGGALAMKVTHPSHIQGAHAPDPLERPFEPERVTQTRMRNDGNNVDIEEEMAQVIKDHVHYSAVAELVTKRYSMLRDAITEGRR